MSINPKVIDKIVSKCKSDVTMRVFLTELLEVEAEKNKHYNKQYLELLDHAMEELKNENN